MGGTHAEEKHGQMKHGLHYEWIIRHEHGKGIDITTVCNVGIVVTHHGRVRIRSFECVPLYTFGLLGIGA